MNLTTIALIATTWAGAPGVDQALTNALDAEARGDYTAAASNYEWAAARDPQLGKFLRYRALEALLKAPEPDQARIDNLAATAAQWGYAGSALAAVHADAKRNGGTPGLAVLKVALKSGDREPVCEVLTSVMEQGKSAEVSPPAELVDLHHAECSDTEIPSYVADYKLEPTPLARVRRAERLHGQVRFIASVAEIEALGDLEKLEPTTLRCRAYFRLGRSIYRIRKRRSESETAYAKAAELCTEKGVRKMRRQSLYAIGKRNFERGRLAPSKVAYETLLADFGETSHADDAVFYLARIARAEKDTKRERELLELAATKYPDGDMFAELIWESFEDLYRAGKYAEFLKEVDAVERPERDEQYYSQGRLEYFTGQALIKLGRADEGYARWQVAWNKYPWSFYGYISRMRLAKADQVVTDPKIEPQAVAPWLQARTWNAGPLGRLSKLDPTFAAAFAPAYKATTDETRWQLAWVHDQAGNYPVSHNIVRRSIKGRPWADPLSARFMQWHLAWPDPFGEAVEAAVAAEMAQNGDPQLRPALPRAIMREESSFIEDIESYAGALGLMQLMPRTALGHDDDIEGDATPDRLKTAAVNMRVGADHIHWLARRFDGHPVMMTAAYNAGAGAVGRWVKRHGNDDIAMFIEDIPALQTRDYTKRVIGSYAAYQWLIHPERPLDDRVLGSGK